MNPLDSVPKKPWQEERKYSDDQPRDEGGRWTGGGSAGGEERLQEDQALFSRYASRWNSASDVDARSVAFDLVMSNPDLHRQLLQDRFGDPVPERVTLYRTGSLASEGISSFFSNEQQAQGYADRMGVQGVREYSARSSRIVPSGAGSGELWVRVDDVEA